MNLRLKKKILVESLNFLKGYLPDQPTDQPLEYLYYKLRDKINDDQLKKNSLIPLLEVKGDKNPPDFEFEKLSEFRKHLTLLENIGLSAFNIRVLKSMQVLADDSDTATVAIDEFKFIIFNIEQLIISVQAAIDAISDITEEETSDQIHIKLPTKESLGGIIDTFQEIKKAVELPVNALGEEAKVQSIEPGSIWISILVGSTIAVRLVGKLVKIATDANLEIQKAKIFGNYAETIKINNELKEQLKKAQDAYLKTLIKKGAEEVDHSDFKEKGEDPERAGRLSVAIKSMSELLTKGAVFMPSLESPKEVQDLFINPAEEMKQLEDGILKSLEKGEDKE